MLVIKDLFETEKDRIYEVGRENRRQTYLSTLTRAASNDIFADRSIRGILDEGCFMISSMSVIHLPKLRSKLYVEDQSYPEFQAHQ